MFDRARLAPALLLALAAACSGGSGDNPDATPIDAVPIDAPVVLPAFRNPVDLPDLQLAQRAAERLGIGSRSACDECHGLTRGRFASWLAETQSADAGCMSDTTPTNQTEARAIIACLSEGGLPKAPPRLGIYTTAGNLAWFEAVFTMAYGPASAEWAAWLNDVPMPRGDQLKLNQVEFDIIAEWFARGLPELETVVPEDPLPPGCTQMIGPEVATHVETMRTEGWGAINRDANLLMLGCAGAANPADCLSSFPLSTSETWATGWTSAAPSTKIRLLHEYGYSSSFWTRSSADGRYVAHGGGSAGRSTIIDLMTGREIPADASYDPGFFPDNSGFVLQGGASPWCRQSLLNSNPTRVTFNEPECSRVGVVGLYQHLGAARGGDYWTVNGAFVSDNGGGDPAAWFGSDSVDRLTAMVWNGTAYSSRQQIPVANPGAGDTIISPSAKLLLSRVAGSGNQQNGFVMRALNATLTGSTYSVTTPTVARYCVNGGKPAFSFDERWLTYHHEVGPNDWAGLGYASASDPAFVARRSTTTTNVYLLDLRTGVTRAITNVEPGQEAVFPHFRSDGWLYFVVKGVPGGGEVAAASDAALIFGS
jgi:hypothetical protein